MFSPVHWIYLDSLRTGGPCLGQVKYAAGSQTTAPRALKLPGAPESPTGKQLEPRAAASVTAGRQEAAPASWVGPALRVGRATLSDVAAVRQLPTIGPTRTARHDPELGSSPGLCPPAARSERRAAAGQPGRQRSLSRSPTAGRELRRRIPASARKGRDCGPGSPGGRLQVSTCCAVLGEPPAGGPDPRRSDRRGATAWWRRTRRTRRR